MKQLINLLLLLPFFWSQAPAAIVNNSISSVTGEDSLSCIFYSLDSLGNPTSADSILILVSGPEGSVVYSDSIAASDSRITVTTIRSRQFYSFADQVSNLDGGGEDGSYSITILAINNSLALATANNFDFQIISSELSDQLAFIDDSVLVKGGAVDSNRTEPEGLDSAAIAGAVWNTAQAGHTAAGTFGRYLDVQVSSFSSGSGAYTFTLVTYDSSLNQVIPAVNLVVRNIDQSALIAVGATDLTGGVDFNLNADDYHVVATATGYIFDTPDTVSVTGAGTDTLFGYQFNPGNPSLPLFCRVYGFVYLVDGTPEVGAAVSAGLPSGVARWDNIIVSPFGVSTTTDSLGYFYLDLIPTDSLRPTGSKYEFSIFRTDGSILRKKLNVPAVSTWRLQW